MRGYYMGPEVSNEAYQWWVSAFEKIYETEAFAQIRAEKGLFPFSKAGAELDALVKERVAALRELAKNAGLIK